MLMIDVKCRGVTPLMMKRILPETLEQLRDKTRKRAKAASSPLPPREEADQYLYKLPDGRPYIPTENLAACIFAGGQHMRLEGKKQMSTAKSTTIPSFLSFLDPYIVLDAPQWEVDMRGGRNPNGGELVCIVRPRFDVWSFEAHLQLDEDQVSEDAIRRLVDLSGRRIGLMEFRPHRKGIFGQFAIDRWVTRPWSVVETQSDAML